MQATTQLANPIILSDAVILAKHEYERLCKLDIAQKVMQGKQQIAEGKTKTHAEVMANLYKVLGE